VSKNVESIFVTCSLQIRCHSTSALTLNASSAVLDAFDEAIDASQHKLAGNSELKSQRRHFRRPDY